MAEDLKVTLTPGKLAFFAALIAAFTTFYSAVTYVNAMDFKTQSNTLRLDKIESVTNTTAESVRRLELTVTELVTILKQERREASQAGELTHTPKELTR